MNKAYSLLTGTGNLVDNAIGILTDNTYRMETDDRRKYLHEIGASLSMILSVFNNLKAMANGAAANKKSSSTYNSNAQKALQRLNQ